MALAAPTLARLAAATGRLRGRGALGGRALALVGIEARMHDRQFRYIHPKLGADAIPTKATRLAWRSSRFHRGFANLPLPA
jgi:hypothetical protein